MLTLEDYVRELVRIAAGAHLQRAVQSRTLDLPVDYFDREAMYDLLRRVTEGAGSRGPALIAEALQLLRTIPQVLTYAVAVALVAPWLPVLLIPLTTLLTWQLMHGGGRMWAIETERTRERRLASYYAATLTSRSHAAEVRVFGLAGELLARWRTCMTSYLTARLRMMLHNATAGTASTAGFSAALAGSLMAISLTQHSIDPGSAALVFTAISGLIDGIVDGIAFPGRDFIEHAGYARDLRALLEHTPSESATPGCSASAMRPSARIHTPPAERRANQASFPHPLRRGIHFEDVSYQYPGSTEVALSNLSLEIKAGETIAVVGPNGAGKSTFASLLLGLRRPTSGTLLADGINLAHVPLPEIRHHCAAVFQEPLRLPATLEDNIAPGESANRDDAEMARILDAVDLRDLLLQSSLRDTNRLLGPEFGGTDLSGGQWQRLAIARALFRKEVDLVVFDEPTAALDALAEVALFERFASLATGRTAVLISHRLGPTLLADRVIVIVGGKLMEQGKPANLAKSGGVFAQMFASQAEWCQRSRN